MEETITNYDRRLANALRNLKASSLSKGNKETILGFVDECFAQGLSKSRAIKYCFCLSKLARWFDRDFKTAAKEDLKTLVLLKLLADEGTRCRVDVSEVDDEVWRKLNWTRLVAEAGAQVRKELFLDISYLSGRYQVTRILNRVYHTNNTL